MKEVRPICFPPATCQLTYPPRLTPSATKQNKAQGTVRGLPKGTAGDRWGWDANQGLSDVEAVLRNTSMTLLSMYVDSGASR